MSGVGGNYLINNTKHDKRILKATQNEQTFTINISQRYMISI